MRRVLPAGILLALSALTIGAGYQAGGGGGGSSSTASSLLRRGNAPNHSFTWTDYLEPHPHEKIGYLCPVFHDADSSFYTIYVAISDSIYDGTGRWADSTAFVGQRVRGTVALIPTDIGSGQRMTVAQLADINTRQDDFEIATHGDHTQRLGAVGQDNAGNQVSYAGETGMSHDFLDATLGATQDSLIAWGLKAARSHVYGNWRLQLGMHDIWRANGYAQATGLAVSVFRDQSNVAGNELSAQQINDDIFPAVAFGKTGSVGYVGFHQIGSSFQFNMYDIGQRSFGSFDTTGSGIGEPLADSLYSYTDVAAAMGCGGIIGFHEIRKALETLPANGVRQAVMTEIMIFWARRQALGYIETVTLEQYAAMMRGYVEGSYVNHHDFTNLADATPASAIMSGNEAPMGFVPYNADFYASSNDQFDSATADRWKIVPSDTVTIGVANTDTLTYGLADDDGNVLVCESGVQNTRGFGGPICVKTNRHRRAVLVTVQAMYIEDNFPGSSFFYVTLKAGQFQEIIEDNVNSGTQAFEAMPWMVGTRNNSQILANFVVERQRIRPVFQTTYQDTAEAGNAWMGEHTDYTVSSTPQTLTVSPRPTDWMATASMAYWFSPQMLRYFAFTSETGANAPDFICSYGNPVSFTATGNALDEHDDNYDPMELPGRPYNYYYLVPANDEVDYIWLYAGIDTPSSSLAAASDVVILDFSVRDL